MTIDEAIKERQKVIEVQEKLYEEASTNESKEIIKSAIDNDRQLAEWLTDYEGLRAEIIDLRLYVQMLEEYREKAKRLLKVAVDDVRYCMRSYVPCEVCALLEENGECVAADDDDCSEKYKWRYEAEALALIGEDGDTNE